ncbi:MAG: hypothetical protein ACOYMW_04260 [Candidatus Competibacteraceae bacterium]
MTLHLGIVSMLHIRQRFVDEGLPTDDRSAPCAIVDYKLSRYA